MGQALASHKQPELRDIPGIQVMVVDCVCALVECLYFHWKNDEFRSKDEGSDWRCAYVVADVPIDGVVRLVITSNLIMSETSWEIKCGGECLCSYIAEPVGRVSLVVCHVPLVARATGRGHLQQPNNRTRFEPKAYSTPHPKQTQNRPKSHLQLRAAGSNSEDTSSLSNLRCSGGICSGGECFVYV